jgi:hypothetical protein
MDADEDGVTYFCNSLRPSTAGVNAHLFMFRQGMLSRSAYGEIRLGRSAWEPALQPNVNR